MPIVLFMPALSPTMTHGHLVKWHRGVGDAVKPGDCLFDIETDKAVMEVEAVDEGILAAVCVPDNSASIAVGTALAVLKEEDDTDQDIETFLQTLQTPSVTQAPAVAAVIETPSPTPTSKVLPLSQKPSVCTQERVIASPLAKKIAQQQGIDLRMVTGSGPHGRIIRQDVEGYVPHTEAPLSQETSLPLSPMRSVIAKRLTESKQTIPHFYLSVDCEMDALLAYRQHMNDALAQKELSVNDLVARACVLALRDTPSMNVQWAETHIKHFSCVDLAIAVSIDGGLITPIVSGADTMGLKAFVKVAHDMIAKARSGQLKPHEYQGGTFTLSNLGMLGIDRFEAIINPPQSGILAVGATKAKAVVKEGSIGIAQIMSATLSADHRVIDGAVGALFLTTFKKYIEHPMLLAY